MSWQKSEHTHSFPSHLYQCWENFRGADIAVFYFHIWDVFVIFSWLLNILNLFSRNHAWLVLRRSTYTTPILFINTQTTAIEHWGLKVWYWCRKRCIWSLVSKSSINVNVKNKESALLWKEASRCWFSSTAWFTAVYLRVGAQTALLKPFLNLAFI